MAYLQQGAPAVHAAAHTGLPSPHGDHHHHHRAAGEAALPLQPGHQMQGRGQQQQQQQHHLSTVRPNGSELGSLIAIGSDGDHERSVASLMKLQAMDECEGRWRDRAEGWQRELREGSERVADLTAKVQHANTARGRLEQMLRQERLAAQGLRENDRTDALLRDLAARDAAAAQHRDEVSDLKKQLSDLQESSRTQQEAAQNASHTLNDSERVWRERAQQHESRATQLESRISHLEAQSQRVESRAQLLESSLQQAERDRDTARSEAAAAEKEAVSLRERVAQQQQGLQACEGAAKEAQHREQSAGSRLRVDREKYASVIKELRRQLEQVESRRRGDKRAFHESVEQLKGEIAELQRLNGAHMREAESLRSLPSQLLEQERAVAALQRRIDTAPRPTAETDPEATDAYADAPWAPQGGVCRGGGGGGGVRCSAVVAPADALHVSSPSRLQVAPDHGARRDLEDRVSTLESRCAALQRDNSALREEKSAVAHERSEWKYKALLAAPAEVRCPGCGAAVTMWPEHPAVGAPCSQFDRDSAAPQCHHSAYAKGVLPPSALA